MSEVSLFDFGGAEIRGLALDGRPWLIARDLCAALGLSNASQALATLHDDEKGVTTNDTPGGPQQIAIVNEPGVYRLIFRSRKPEAEQFKRWIFHDVLPAIRETGTYQLPGDPQARAAIVRDHADMLAKHLRSGLIDRDSARELARRDLEATYGTLPDAPPPPDPAVAAKARADALRAEILKIVAANPGLTGNGVHLLVPHNKNAVLRALHAAVADGAVRVKDGRNRSRHHYIADATPKDAR